MHALVVDIHFKFPNVNGKISQCYSTSDLAVELDPGVPRQRPDLVPSRRIDNQALFTSSMLSMIYVPWQSCTVGRQVSCDRSSGSFHIQPALRNIVLSNKSFRILSQQWKLEKQYFFLTFSPSYSSVNSAFSCSGKSLHIWPMIRPISQSFSSGFSFFTLEEKQVKVFPKLQCTNLVPNPPAVPHIWHQGLLGCFWRFRDPMSWKCFGADSLRVEGVVAVLLRREGVGLHLVLLLLSHQITLWA